MGDNVFASRESREAYPIIDKLPEILGDDVTENVIFVTPNDFIAALEALGTTDATYQALMLKEHENGSVTDLTYNSGRLFADASHHEQAFLQLIANIQPGLSGRFSEDATKEIIRNLEKNEGYGAFRTDADITDVQNTDVLVVMPSEPRAKEEIAAIQTGFPKEVFTNLSGNDHDWAASVIFHEIGHKDLNPDVGSHLRAEVVADLERRGRLVAGFNDASLSEKYNVDLWPQIFVEEQHLRAIASFSESAPSHVTNAAIQIEGEPEAPSGISEDFIDGLMKAREEVYKDLAENLMSRDERIYALVRFRRSVNDISDKDAQVINRILEDPENASTLSGELSEDVKEEYDEFMEKRLSQLGYTKASENPSELYETTRRMYLEGAFDDNPYGKQYAFEFLRGVQALAPTVIPEGLDREETFEPPSFDDKPAEATPAPSGNSVPIIERVAPPQ